MTKHKTLYAALAALLLASPAPAADKKAKSDNSTPLTPEEILKKVTAPAEFDMTVFASPPNISYPIFISSAPDGTLFVGCDPNGSLDRKPGVGKIMRCIDSTGSGKADKFNVFATVDSPRGVAWDASTRTLYVMHPPNLTAYHDDNNTGVATRQEDLITGLGFGLDFRGADHTTNGCRLGIDGWIYIAVGDYGAVKATGKDGRTLNMRGGGIVRVRPDGTGMEQVVWGTRNILAVAFSPTMEIFTRDNTNDGDGWNDRLSHMPFGANMGYPTYYMNFADEMIPTMMDYGGGSPVGSVFIDEPGYPKGYGYGLYTVEWGRSVIDHHPLTQVGATWKADQNQFMKMTRATDMDVDGATHIYAASWDGATFTYNGPNVGYITRLTPKDAKAVKVPDFKKLTEAQLVETIGGPSGVWRQAAQRELLLRGAKPGVAEGLQKIVQGTGTIGEKAAAMYTLKLLLGAKSHEALAGYTKTPELREFALKVLADDLSVADKVPVQPFLDGLIDKDPRVRLQAVTGIMHLNKADSASHLISLTADPDFTVAHMAVRALMWLKASDACFNALDSSDSKTHKGVLRALQSMYEPKVVDGLLKRLSTKDEALHKGILSALCRIDQKEAPYVDPKMWWGTRPDTSGPIYKAERWEESDKIEAALKQALNEVKAEDAKFLVQNLTRNKINFPGLTDLMLAKAGNDTAAKLNAIESLAGDKGLPEDAIKALRTITDSPKEQPELRVRGLHLLMKGLEKNVGPAADAFAPLATVEQQGPLSIAWEEFTRDARLGKHINNFAKLAKDKDAGKRALGQTVLVNILTSTVIKDKKQKEQAQKAIDELWAKPELAASLLGVIGRGHVTQFAAQVRENLNNKDHVVAEAAEFALTKLGLDKTGSPTAKLIGEMKYEDVVKAAIAAKGNAKTGGELFLKQGCVICHTVNPNEAPKGPYLGGITTRYSKAELCESILKPSAKIAQGFESQWFKLKDTNQVEGFVTKEGGDSVEIRTIVGTTMIIEKANIQERGKRETSMMPEGLVGNVTPDDLASLLEYLDSTKAADAAGKKK